MRGLKVSIAHIDCDERVGRYRGAIELDAGIDLRWTDAIWTCGWEITTPNGARLDRPFGADLYPLPTDVAEEAEAQLTHMRQVERLRDLARKAKRAMQVKGARQSLADAVNTHLHRRYRAASLDDLGWCGFCRLDIDLDGYCDCDPTLMRFGKPVNP
ncbi:hypothetical protein ACFVWN_20505 [Nocardiopsis flavescens]|uniref:hypothetical protein n=1 Tax=Nocardiopsis flavescens TaxID=758803 RepID=UPI00364E4D30